MKRKKLLAMPIIALTILLGSATFVNAYTVKTASVTNIPAWGGSITATTTVKKESTSRVGSIKALKITAWLNPTGRFSTSTGTTVSDSCPLSVTGIYNKSTLTSSCKQGNYYTIQFRSNPLEPNSGNSASVNFTPDNI